MSNLLKMYLDADRDGTVDAAPATYADWQWGAGRLGGIILVRTHVYQGTAAVPERCEVRFTWDQGAAAAPGWTARLALDQPARVRIYAGQAFNAQQIDATSGIDIGSLTPTSSTTGQVSIWIEAADFGTDDQEASWRVRLSYTFTTGTEAHQQSAQLRIAPWIMASDLEPTTTVFAVGANSTSGYPPAVATFVQDAQQATGATLQLVNEVNLGGGGVAKPFLRDVMKSGFCHAPHRQDIVIHKGLDTQSQYGTLPGRVAGAGTIARPNPNDNPTSQDNGGNLLVTPPLPGYPLGRILYGEAPHFACNAAPFYRAQMIQKPFAVDPSWMSVGHVDEFISFVPYPNGAGSDPWPWRVLLMGPRIGYILAHAASAQAGRTTLSTLCDQADRVDAQLRQMVQPDWNALSAACVAAFGALQPAIGGAPQPPGQYLNDPPAPAGQNGRIVLWNSSAGYTSTSIDAYLATPGPNGLGLLHPQLFDFVRQRIDPIRTTLRTELGGGRMLDQKYVVDIPVLLNATAGIVTDTADSVNMLVLRAGANGARCLVPKPFGPVCGDTYLFEYYIRRRLETLLGLQITFINDWEYLHVHEGEVHCGTNQIPTALPGGRAWWLQQPGPVLLFRPLSTQ